MINSRVKKQLSIALTGLVCGGVLVKDVDAISQNNLEGLDEADANLLNARSGNKTGKVTATSLNVRKGPSTNQTIIGYLTEGQTVEVVSTESNGWCQIKYGSGYGYVSEAYISVSSGSSSSSTTSSATTITHTGKVNASGLNIRNGASTSYSVIGYLSRGTTVNIVDQLGNGWYKIKLSNGYGYISGDYITDVKTVSSSNGSSSSTTVTHTGKVNTASLNVRSGASTSYSVIGYLSSGTTVNIVDQLSNGWYKIKFSSGYGYISGEYVSQVAQVGSSTKTGTVNTTTLKVRSGASTSYSVIGALSRGTKVEIVKTESNGWYKIKYGSGYGYVSGSYISMTGDRKNLDNFLFIGDSFTVGIKNIITSKNNNAYVYAKSGSRPSYWIDKVSSMPSNSNVDGVSLLIGVNGASTTSNKNDVKTLITSLSKKYYNKTIYVQKVFPVGREFTGANPASFNASIASLNSVIESHCKTLSNVKFIDATSGFVDSSGYLINHNGDGLHIASSYSNTFYNNILNAIKAAE